MSVKTFSVQGPMLIDVKVFKDDRGFFAERYKKNWLEELGLKLDFVQDNFSRSDFQVLRGLHYQFDQPQGKLLTCVRGRIFDVIVDIRKKSATFGQHITVELDGDNPQWFWIPPGFAHGFVVTSKEGADSLYKVDTYYNGKGEGSILWKDPDLKISWPITNPRLSPKDDVAMSFSQYCLNPKF